MFHFDGPENLEIGQETNLGQVYAEFQSYVKSLKDYGVMLNVASKNEEENALAGLNVSRPFFVCFSKTYFN